MEPITIIRENYDVTNNPSYIAFCSIINEQNIAVELKTCYKDAFRFLLSSLDCLVYGMAKEDGVNITYELHRCKTKSSKCVSFGSDSLILISEKDIINLIEIIDLPVVTNCYELFQADLLTLPPKVRFDYSEYLYKSTLLITAIYLIFGHEATHSLVVATNYQFSEKQLEEKQCDKSSCRLVENLVESIMLSFEKNKLLSNIPRGLFKGALVVNILTGVLVFCKQITDDSFSESSDYPPKTTRRIVSLISTILALPLESYYTKDTLSRLGVDIYSILFSVTAENACDIFNAIAEENNYLC